MFKVEIIKTDKRLGVKVGEIYWATRAPYDNSKVVLTSRIPDGYDPCAAQYIGVDCKLVKD
ncbi:hypothetical protein NVP1121O_007 [Vibrio phage 1.121.O._10N.286.46.C4]|nr:hypothetical protein NVP1121O_007 [Vibrio phage 1.121.O._10N.286.46.C4]